MSCYGCGTSFSLFKKEHGCKNCGFAFCNSCLTKKLAVPKLNNEKHHVCNKCFNILTGKIKPNNDPARYSPPEAYKKRIAALADREAGHSSGHTTNTHQPKPTAKSEYKHLTKPEREIQERLDKLKDGPKQTAGHFSQSKKPEREIQERLDKLKEGSKQTEASKMSQNEIEQRLAMLKGHNPAVPSSSKPHAYQAPDRRTQQDQINSLLDEIGAEIEIDSHRLDPVKDIENRLAGLKGTTEPKEPNKPSTGNNLNREDSQEKVPFKKNINGNGTPTPDDKKPDTRTNDEIPIEELQNLIAEASKGLEVDAQKALEDLQKDKEIMKKLQEVKNRKKEDVNKDTEDKSEDDVSDSDNENEETLTKNLIKQMLEENKLDEAAAKDGVDLSSTQNSKKAQNIPSSKKKQNTGAKKPKKAQNIEPEFQQDRNDDDDDDELPYCVLCTEDATIRCHGCDYDLYCSRCWKESHGQFEMDDHVTSKYVQKKGKT